MLTVLWVSSLGGSSAGLPSGHSRSFVLQAIRTRWPQITSLSCLCISASCWPGSHGLSSSKKLAPLTKGLGAGRKGSPQSTSIGHASACITFVNMPVTKECCSHTQQQVCSLGGAAESPCKGAEPWEGHCQRPPIGKKMNGPSSGFSLVGLHVCQSWEDPG